MQHAWARQNARPEGIGVDRFVFEVFRLCRVWDQVDGWIAFLCADFSSFFGYRNQGRDARELRSTPFGVHSGENRVSDLLLSLRAFQQRRAVDTGFIGFQDCGLFLSFCFCCDCVRTCFRSEGGLHFFFPNRERTGNFPMQLNQCRTLTGIDRKMAASNLVCRLERNLSAYFLGSLF